MQKIIITIFVLLSSAILLGNLPIDLNVQQQGSNYRLMWIPQSWNSSWQGVAIAYRPVGTTSWTYWNTEAIEPGISPQRVFSKQGISTASELGLRSKYDYFMNSNNMPPATFRNALATSPDGLPAREAMCMFDDFNCALSMGLGAVISVNSLVGIYEFALFPVMANGSTGSEMIAFHSMIDIGPQIIAQTPYTTQNLLNAIRIDWEIPASLAKEAKIFGFNIYKIEQGTVSLLHKHVGKLPGEFGNVYKYAFTYPTPLTSTGHTFILAPANYFKEELAQIQIQYVPELAEDKSRIIVEHFMAPVSNSSDGNPVINIIAGKLPKGTSKISVERFDAVSGEFRTIASNLLPQTVSWTDAEQLDFAVSYSYRLRAETSDGKTVYSNLETVVNLGSPKPAPVNNVSAELHRKGDQAVVKLKWHPLLHQKPAVKGYRILSDVHETGTFVLHSSIPVITGNQFEFPLNGSFSNKTVTFQVVAITEYSQSGDEGGLVQVKIPSLRLPEPQNINIAKFNASSVDVNWEYSGNHVFDGFELSVNGQKVADMRTLGPSSRSFSITDPKPDSRGIINIELKAVNHISQSAPAKISRKLPDNLLRATHVNSNMTKPQGFSVHKVIEDGILYAEFRWNNKPSDFGGVAYFMHADLEEPGIVMPMRNFPLLVVSPFRYEIPDPDRSQYIFEFTAVNKKNERGPATRLTLNLN
jgi:hypothetical protein